MATSKMRGRRQCDTVLQLSIELSKIREARKQFFLSPSPPQKFSPAKLNTFSISPSPLPLQKILFSPLNG
ncbi:hypothetical protein GOP47_0021775 [Adiantum capillus-veneris]|uniref:Uncharacterized protein n=1 Tax=Adiantum capillus-veneris TaxID=13818 RepID=A0A9D4U913_ADICA|nr:hypothetical protein GOP47_0021775 [Adiantum capillus-veneris]